MYWYIRTKNEVTGPFPEGQVQQSVLLGRIDLNTEVSRDRDEWQPLRAFPELVPEVLKGDPDDPKVQERLNAARRWADERRGERREADEPDRTGPGRRTPESAIVQEYRDHREEVIDQLHSTGRRNWSALVIIFGVLALGVYAAFNLIPPSTPPADCTAAAAPSVNWRYCQFPGVQLLNQDLRGANLHSSNFQGSSLVGTTLSDANMAYASLAMANMSFTKLDRANLKGADMRNVDLTHASLADANLSYANLTDAIIDNANFRGVNLENAIWVNGRTCQAGSIGECRFAKD